MIYNVLGGTLNLAQTINDETWHKYSTCEWALLKRFSRSEVKGQGHDQTECYDGGGMHFNCVAQRFSRLYLRYELNSYTLCCRLTCKLQATMAYVMYNVK